MVLAEPAMRGFLIWEARLAGHKSGSAYFCSELIVHIYEAMGLDVARDNTTASSFAPDDLSDPKRSMFVPVDIVRSESPVPKEKKQNSHDDQLLADTKNALAYSAKVLRKIEKTHRKMFSEERLRNYLRAVALKRIPELADKERRIRNSVDALLSEGNGLMNLCLNLEDLSAIPKSSINNSAHAALRDWCQMLKLRLARDAPVSSRVRDLTRAGLSDINSAGATDSVVRETHKAYRTLLRNIIRLHAAASLLNQRLLDTLTPNELLRL
jgi:hypothetical protein